MSAGVFEWALGVGTKSSLVCVILSQEMETSVFKVGNAVGISMGNFRKANTIKRIAMLSSSPASANGKTSCVRSPILSLSPSIVFVRSFDEKNRYYQ